MGTGGRSHPAAKTIILGIDARWCETGDALEDIVRHVLIHEIGHHFGFSDEDMERFEDED